MMLSFLISSKQLDQNMREVSYKEFTWDWGLRWNRRSQWWCCWTWYCTELRQFKGTWRAPKIFWWLWAAPKLWRGGWSAPKIWRRIRTTPELGLVMVPLLPAIKLCADIREAGGRKVKIVGKWTTWEIARERREVVGDALCIIMLLLVWLLQQRCLIPLVDRGRVAGIAHIWRSVF